MHCHHILAQRIFVYLYYVLVGKKCFTHNPMDQGAYKTCMEATVSL